MRAHLRRGDRCGGDVVLIVAFDVSYDELLGAPGGHDVMSDAEEAGLVEASHPFCFADKLAGRGGGSHTVLFGGDGLFDTRVPGAADGVYAALAEEGIDTVADF